ncbi:hypothetical protein Patl1_06268 [Pistacia atlantica]|uniref:Uncharacterized protein n=1 Tax=Pistacia atlantica TaxID=434234 RepID=A0ACC1BWA7_9ROSI|nr:hypothetical protein Patl1_06268 [Pistacia atlantica]
MVKAAEDLKFALVMKFMRVRPSMDKLCLHVVKNWGLIEIPQISFKDDYHILIHMKNERDFVHGCTREGRSVEGNSFRLFKWTKDFDIKKESPLAPQWIFLPGLPMHLYRKDCLRILVTRFGRFLGTDNATLNKTRATGARLCIEMNLKEGAYQRVPYYRIGEARWKAGKEKNNRSLIKHQQVWKEKASEEGKTSEKKGETERVVDNINTGNLVQSDEMRQNEVPVIDHMSALVEGGITDNHGKDMPTLRISKYMDMAQSNSTAEVQLVDEVVVEPVIRKEAVSLTGSESRNDVAVREDKHGTLSDSKDEDGPSALARQKQYNSEPECNQPSRKME